jgi:CubicO group peptidase (beta-lactamase class C family)
VLVGSQNPLTERCAKWLLALWTVLLCVSSFALELDSEERGRTPSATMGVAQNGPGRSEDPIALKLGSAIEASIDAYAGAPATPRVFSGVVIIAKDGKILAHRAYGFADWPKKVPNTLETAFEIFSVTKQFTAAVVLRLADRRMLSLADPVSKYFPTWPQGWQAVTLHHLLTHSAGIDIDTQSLWLFRQFPEYEYFGDPPPVPRPVFEMKPLLSEPGTTFRYSNAGYTLLSRIVAQVAGKPFRDVMRSEVFGPVGMTHSSVEGLTALIPRARGHRLSLATAEYDEQGLWYIPGAGDMITTASDLVKWDQALYDSSFLSPSALKAMFTPTVSARNGRLGYGWLIQELPNQRSRSFFSGGGSGFACYVVRRADHHSYVAILANAEAPGLFAHALDLADRVDVILSQK